METGAEITDNTAHAAGHISDLYYFDTSYDSINGWSGASIPTPSPIVTSISMVGSGHAELSWSTCPCD